MTPDEDALLSAVAAAPADDLPRLVYADWLEEHGNTVRAEFIRLQIEIAKLETGPRAVIDRNVRLWERQQEILDTQPDKLVDTTVPELPAGLSSFLHVFERGFLKSIELPAGQFGAWAGELAAFRPMPGVAVRVDADELAGVEASPHLGVVTAVRIDWADTDEGGEPPFTDSFAPDRWPGFTRLRTLHLADCHITDAGVGAIPWADLPALVDLDLANNSLTDAGVVALINTGLPQRLERLVLGGNPLTDQGAYELADRVGRSRTLKHLNLRYTNLTNDGQGAILARFGGRVDLF